jgi:hypothetical protein
MLQAGVPVGIGTDATRVASYNPWVGLYWLATGKTLGGLQLYGDANILSREEALALWTHGSAWFSKEQDRKGRLAVGQYADFAVLSDDYFAVTDDRIQDITSVLTVVGGRVVHGDAEFTGFAPELPAPMPEWSPVREFGGYQGGARAATAVSTLRGQLRQGRACGIHGHGHAAQHPLPARDEAGFWGALGCSCFAF